MGKTLYKLKERLLNQKRDELLNDVQKNLSFVKVKPVIKDSILKVLKNDLIKAKQNRAILNAEKNKKQAILNNFKYLINRSNIISIWEKEFREKCIMCSHRGCYQQFASNQNLQRHLMIHSGEKPFECAVCKRKFRQRDELRRHQIKWNYGSKPHVHVCRSRYSKNVKKDLKQK